MFTVLMTQSQKNLVNEATRYQNKTIDVIMSINSLNDFFDGEWQITRLPKNLLTAGQLDKFNNAKYTLPEIKRLLLQRLQLKTEKEIAKKQKELAAIYEVKPLEYGYIDIEWTRTSMWGNQPSGNFRNGSAHYTAKRPNSSGIDLVSVVTSNLFNQDKRTLRAVVDYVDAHKITKLDRDNLGYGIYSFYGIPYFDHGVGLSSQFRTLENLGYKVTHHASYGRTRRIADTISIDRI